MLNANFTNFQSILLIPNNEGILDTKELLNQKFFDEISLNLPSVVKLMANFYINYLHCCKMNYNPFLTTNIKKKCQR